MAITNYHFGKWWKNNYDYDKTTIEQRTFKGLTTLDESVEEEHRKRHQEAAASSLRTGHILEDGTIVWDA